MPVINIDLEDGKPPVSFNLKPGDTDRFKAFMDQYHAQSIAMESAQAISTEKLSELISGLRSINRSKHHEVPKQYVDDDEPCYWQRKQWIDWMLELAAEAEREVENVRQQVCNLKS